MLVVTTNDLPGYGVDEVLGEVFGLTVRSRGANAILAKRFDTSEMGNVWTEICAYGTAVKVTKL